MAETKEVPGAWAMIWQYMVVAAVMLVTGTSAAGSSPADEDHYHQDVTVAGERRSRR